MKKLIFLALALLLIPASSMAWWIVMQGGGVESGGGGGGDSCTDGLIFSAHFETDEDIDTSVGCVDNSYFTDTTGTTNGTVSIVTGADGYVLSEDGTEYIEFDIATMPDPGSALVKYNEVVYSSESRAFSFYGDADDYLTFKFQSSNDAAVYWIGQGSYTQGLANAGNLVYNTDYWCVIRWDSSDVNPNFGVEIYNMSETLVDSGSSDSNPTAFGTSPTKLRIGNDKSDETGDTRIYSFKIYDTYNGAPTSGF